MSSTNQPPKSKRIGFIGKANIDATEEAILTHLGQCIVKLGHAVVITTAPGASTALRKGVEVEGGKLVLVAQGVIEASDHTTIYPDPPLLEKLETKYPDLHTRTDVLVLHPSQLGEWYDAVKLVMEERGIH